MNEPVDTCRQEVIQRIQLAQSEGGWEGTHTDFKKELDSTPQAYAKLLKHVLAFANTPRRTDAYIIFGVSEDRTLRQFEHTGVTDARFPTPETIYNLLRSYTGITDVFVDSHFTPSGKLTPYLMIPLQYHGPNVLSRPVQGAPDVIAPGEVVCRYGSSSIRATERDTLRMKADWDTWFLDCRYEKTAKTLIDTLAKQPRALLRNPHGRRTVSGKYLQ